VTEVHEFDVDVRAGHIHGQRFGSPGGRLVFGVHGLTLNMKAFDFIGERVADDTIQLVAVDLRGRGLSEVTPPGSYGWESHAIDVIDLADYFGFDHFSIIGQSMGASIAMKAAELERERLQAVVLIDVIGRVDPGIGAVVASGITQLDNIYESRDAYLDAIRSTGFIDPWDDYWARCHLYNLMDTGSGMKPRGDPVAIAEDRAYGLAQDPYGRWAHLTMPTLLLRAGRELVPGSGYAIPSDDLEAFQREVPHGVVIEVAANHLTINTHPDTPAAIRSFLETRG
jgi:pimeloyl-ACP methyl ester carboxylesterase